MPDLGRVVIVAHLSQASTPISFLVEELRMDYFVQEVEILGNAVVRMLDTVKHKFTSEALFKEKSKHYLT